MMDFVKLQMYGISTALILFCFGPSHVYPSRCSVGRFGDDCGFTCHCAQRGCDPDTGQCDVTECQNGWQGPCCYVASSDLAFKRTVNQSSVNSNHRWDASKAVDGYPGEDSCSHTYPNAWREAWWMVDLGQNHTMIKTINIVFKQQHKFIISGYYVYVSSRSPVRQTYKGPPRGSHLCYHDNTKTSDGPPPYRQSHQCSVTGRYVIVYNNRSSSLPNSPAHYSPEDAVVELCDVQVFSCSSTTFGPNCNKACHCLKDGCNPVVGTCHVPGCQRGWSDDSCSIRKCPDRFFGPNCATECHCQTGGCDIVNGSCNTGACQDGWRGDACNQECAGLTYGPSCKNTCHCVVSSCNSQTGVCTVPGCTAGWRGPSCSEVCARRHFGPDCRYVCQCKTGGCSRIDGTCDIAGCNRGWMGLACDTMCTAGRFGEDCQHECHCKEEGCDSVDGKCDVTGCVDGWRGQSCDHTCDLTHYGPNCLYECHCKLRGCSNTNGICQTPGCKDGWTGPTCSIAEDKLSGQANCSHECETEGFTGYALLSTFLAISISFNIGFLIQFIRTRRKYSSTQTTANDLQIHNIQNRDEDYDSLDSSKIDKTSNTYDTAK